MADRFIVRREIMCRTAPIQEAMMWALKKARGPVMLYSIEGPWDYGDPVHENLCLAAIYQQRIALGVADANFNTLWVDPRLNEFLRGVFWNDDPEVLMFDQDPNSDSNFSNGYVWGRHFEAAAGTTTIDPTNLTGRSHFWDMQFVHGMACATGELPQTTQQRAMMWAEFMYKVSIGQPVDGSSATALQTPAAVAATQLGAVRIPASPTGGQSTIAGYFNTGTVPKSSQTIGYLLTRNDPYTGLDMGKRAIGSVMHLIQDSYARGHTQRMLLNPNDLVSATVNSITFKPGTYGEWGNVITFHSYRGQADGPHKKFDQYTGMNPTDLSTFNGLVGGRDAIANCSLLLGYYADKVLWENGPQALLQQIFALATNATEANTEVNRVPLQFVWNTGTGAVGTVDPHYVLVNGNSTSSAYIVSKDQNWATPPDGAMWISPNPDTQGATETYTYRVTLFLSGYNTDTVVLAGQICGDDSVQSIAVNGRVVTYAFGSTPVTTDPNTPPTNVPKAGPSWGKLARFLINEPGLFVPGSNTIDFTVPNNGGGPAGLMVAFDRAAAVATTH